MPLECSTSPAAISLQPPCSRPCSCVQLLQRCSQDDRRYAASPVESHDLSKALLSCQALPQDLKAQLASSQGTSEQLQAELGHERSATAQLQADLASQREAVGQMGADLAQLQAELARGRTEAGSSGAAHICC